MNKVKDLVYSGIVGLLLFLSLDGLAKENVSNPLYQSKTSKEQLMIKTIKIPLRLNNQYKWTVKTNHVKSNFKVSLYSKISIQQNLVNNYCHWYMVDNEEDN